MGFAGSFQMIQASDHPRMRYPHAEERAAFSGGSAPALIWSISKHYSMGSFVDKKTPMLICFY